MKIYSFIYIMNQDGELFPALGYRNDVGNNPTLDNGDTDEIERARIRRLLAERRKEKKQEKREDQEIAKILTSMDKIQYKITKQKQVSRKLRTARSKTKKRKKSKSHKKRRISRRRKK